VSCLRKLGEEVHKSSDWVKGRATRLYFPVAGTILQSVAHADMETFDMMLRDPNAKINMRSADGQGVLHAVSFLRRRTVDCDNMEFIRRDRGKPGFDCMKPGFMMTIEYVPFLVGLGADVNMKTHHGVTPLMILAQELDYAAELWALEQGSYDRLAMIESLLDHKADPNLRAGPAALLVGRKPHIAGKTALEIAKEGKYPAVANFLEALPARTFAAHPYGCRFVEKATAPFAI
jgi:ankyrin repeat protein